MAGLSLQPKQSGIKMNESGIKNPNASLSKIGLNHTANAYWNLSPAEVVEHTITRGLGVLADSGA